MTTTAQPLNFKREHVALMVVTVWLALFTALGTVIWAYYSTQQYRVIQNCMGVVLLQISILVCRSTRYQFFSSASICFTRSLGCVFGMAISPATYSGAASFWICTAPVLLIALAGAASTMFMAFLSVEWLLTFGAKFHHVFHYSIENEQVGVVFPGSPPRSLVEYKIQRKGEVALWPRHRIFSLLHYSSKKCGRLCQLPRLVGHYTERYSSKFPLIDLEGAIPDKAEAVFPVHRTVPHRERLSEGTSLWDGAIVCSASNRKMQNPTEMIGSLLSCCSVTS